MGNLRHNNSLISSTVTGAYHEHTRIFFFYPDVDVHQAFIRSFFRFEIYFFKIAQPVQIGIACFQFAAGINIFFHYFQLTADNLIPGDSIARDGNTVEIDQSSLTDVEINISQLFFLSDVNFRINIGIGISFIGVELS